MGLSILRDTNFETTNGGVNDKNNTIILGGTTNHVLDEIKIRSSKDSAVVLGGLKLPKP